jgi:DNA-binding MurR/RpiR family transcriptional regulator
MENQSILDHLISIKNTLPKKQKIVCNYIIENYQEISVLAIAELSKRIGVGQTTVMRFIKNVGYSSFNDFKRQFHYYTLESSKPTWWHLEKSLANEKKIESGTLEQTWKEIITLLDKSVDQQLISQFENSIDLMINSKMINIIGLRTSKAAAFYFEYMLTEIYPNIRQLSYDSEFIYDRLLSLDKNDVIVIFALSPYSTISVEVAQHCFKEGIPIILITDHLSCPISSYARHILTVKASQVQYSIVPVIALIEAVVIEIGQRTSGHSIKRLSKLNKILTDKNITTS